MYKNIMRNMGNEILLRVKSCLLCLLIAMTISLSPIFINDTNASNLPKIVKEKADLSLEILKDATNKGYDVSRIIPKMKNVKVLGQLGRLEEANDLLDEIINDFRLLEAENLQSQDQRFFTNDKVVNIIGYNGDAMEVFISRDGRYLFFNSMRTENRSKDLFYAEKIDDYNYKFKGEIKPLNSSAVEGVPTLDKHGNFFFISTRNYKPFNLVTMYQGKFKEGKVEDVRPIPELSLNKGGWLNMDSEISEDGNTLYSTHSYFKRGQTFPSKSYFFYAKKQNNKFVPQSNSPDIFKNINKDKIVYGASISKNELEIFYTRLIIDQNKFESLRATRPNKTIAFGKPQIIKEITGFSEAPALNDREDLLYYHKKSGPNGQFRIHVLHRNK